jgi:SAM-dependent methyltransferase
MSYSSITFDDRNPLKRWLQRQRLLTAVNAYGVKTKVGAICDFGAGNGELSKLLAEVYPTAKIVCYEPAPDLLSQARENLEVCKSRIEFCGDIGDLQNGTFDAVFCLEVFEHLPPVETDAALKNIFCLLQPQGKVIVGVPVEIGIPALYKGIFRMCRRYGAFDAKPKNILPVIFGLLPKRRPIGEIGPGLRFHFEHLGFDHRHLRGEISRYFNVVKVCSAPYQILGTWLMPEVNLVAIKQSKAC